MGSPQGSDGKESARKAKDPGLIPGLGRSPGEGTGNPLQYSCLENSMDRGNWWATVHRVTKCWTQLSNLAHGLHVKVVKRVNPEFSSQERIFFPKNNTSRMLW